MRLRPYLLPSPSTTTWIALNVVGLALGGGLVPWERRKRPPVTLAAALAQPEP